MGGNILNIKINIDIIVEFSVHLECLTIAEEVHERESYSGTKAMLTYERRWPW